MGRDADAEAVPACMIVRVVPLFYWLDLLLDGLLDRLCWNHGWKLTFRDAGNSFADYRRSLHLVSDLKTAPPFKDVASAMGSYSALHHSRWTKGVIGICRRLC